MVDEIIEIPGPKSTYASVCRREVTLETTTIHTIRTAEPVRNSSKASGKQPSAPLNTCGTVQLRPEQEKGNRASPQVGWHQVPTLVHRKSTPTSSSNASASGTQHAHGTDNHRIHRGGSPNHPHKYHGADNIAENDHTHYHNNKRPGSPPLKSNTAWTNVQNSPSSRNPNDNYAHHNQLCRCPEDENAKEIFLANNPTYKTDCRLLDVHRLNVGQALYFVAKHIHWCRAECLSETFIITGWGRHSPGRKPILRPKVLEYLETVPCVKAEVYVPNPGRIYVIFLLRTALSGRVRKCHGSPERLRVSTAIAQHCTH